MYVDVHNHVIPTSVIDLVASDASYGVQISDGEWGGALSFPLVDEFFDPAAKLKHLDEVGIAGAVVSMSPPGFFYDRAPGSGLALWDAANAGMAEFCADHGDRLRWLAHLPMQDPDAAVAAYRQAVDAGASGAAVGTSIAGRRLDEEQYERFWSVAEEIDRPVLVHPWFNEPHAALNSFYLQNVIGNPLETTVVVERMICAGVFQRHPGIRLILMHGGGFLPYQTGRLCHAREVRPELAGAPSPGEIWRAFQQLYFDTITHDADSLRYLASKVGLDHVVLGTDMPFDMAMQTPMETLREVFDEAEVMTIAEDTPARLFGLGR